MSEAASYRYRIEEERRRKMELERIAETTNRFLDKFSSMYKDMVSQGFISYIPTEMEQVQERIAEARSMVTRDPARAQRASLELGAFISGLPAMARSVKAEYEEKERQRIAELKEARTNFAQDVSRFFEQEILSLADPVVRDFAIEGIRALQEEMNRNQVTRGQLAEIKKELVRKMSVIRAEAQRKAAEWKLRKAQDHEAESSRDLLGIHRELVAEETRENPEALQEILATLDAERQRIDHDKGAEAAEVQKKVEEAVRKADEAVLDERLRKESVRAIVQSLKSAGFILPDPPKRIREGGKDEVVIRAQRPAGSEVHFSVSLNGDFFYKFSRYEGSACKKDITQLTRSLNEIYGVNLSEKRVIWENPDRISASSRPLDDEQGGGRHVR